MKYLALSFAIAVAMLGCGSTGIGGRNCSLIGCISQAVFLRDYPLGGDVTVRLCRAGTCSEGMVKANTKRVELSGSLNVFVDNEMNRITITFSGTWAASRQASTDDLTDGETIAITITGMSGVIVDATRTMTYTHSFPNGKECGPDCKSAMVSL